MAAALETGRVSVAALTLRNAIRFLDKGWPLLVDLSKTDFIYPPSCVTSSRAFVRDQPGVVERFLKAYVEAIRLFKKDRAFAERVYTKVYRESDPKMVRKMVEVYGEQFKSVPYVPDQCIDVVVNQMAQRRAVPKEFLRRPEQFRDNSFLEKLVKSGWVDQLYK